MSIVCPGRRLESVSLPLGTLCWNSLRFWANVYIAQNIPCTPFYVSFLLFLFKRYVSLFNFTHECSLRLPFDLARPYFLNAPIKTRNLLGNKSSLLRWHRLISFVLKARPRNPLANLWTNRVMGFDRRANRVRPANDSPRIRWKNQQSNPLLHPRRLPRYLAFCSSRDRYCSTLKPSYKWMELNCLRFTWLPELLQKRLFPRRINSSPMRMYTVGVEKSWVDFGIDRVT